MSTDGIYIDVNHILLFLFLLTLLIKALYNTTVNVQYIQIRTFALRYNLVGITMTFDTI